MSWAVIAVDLETGIIRVVQSGFRILGDAEFFASHRAPKDNEFFAVVTAGVHRDGDKWEWVYKREGKQS